MADSPGFAPDLYRGTAEYYERFRPGYPQRMIEDLLGRVRPTGRGRLLDLACGTGQVAFAIQERFAEVWAVDQEPDMIAVVRAKTHARGEDRWRTVVGAAEGLEAPGASFELVTIGNAFHRLHRAETAGRALHWLEPGGCIALLWASSPWSGDASWQRSLAALLEEWKVRTGAQSRVSAGWERIRSQQPDTSVLVQAGFEPVTSAEFPAGHEWTAESLIGFVYSTSVLPRPVVGDLADEFEAELRRELGRHSTDGRMVETIRFAYELARRPG